MIKVELQMIPQPNISADEVEYVFYIETQNKFRKYLYIIDQDDVTWLPFMHEATKFTVFKHGFAQLKKRVNTPNVKVGFVKIIKKQEWNTLVL